MAGIALIDSRPMLAGLFLSLSIALKLYSVVFIPWLLLTRRRTAALTATSFSFVWFVALPVLYWGVIPSWEIYTSWFQRVHETGASEFPIKFLPFAFLTSLHAAVFTVLERLPLTNPLDAALIVTRGIQFIWLVAVVCVLTCVRCERSSQTTLIDASLLLLLPLPLSGQMQPHHLVVLLPASVLILSVAIDRTQPRMLRGLCVIVLVAAFVVLEFGPRPPWRGLGVNSALLLYFIGLVGVKRSVS
jgi:hypothetical protein